MQHHIQKNIEKDFNLLAESMPQIVWVTDADGKNIYFNHQWVEYTGLTLEESYGDGWNKPFHPEDQKRAWVLWQNATKQNATYSLECRLRSAKGEYKWWLVRGVPVLDQNGAILKWFGTCTDIDQIKHTEITLRQSELRSRLVLDSAVADAIYVHDPEGIIQTWNIGAERIIGYKANEIIGKHYSMFFTEKENQEDRPNKELRLALEKGIFSDERMRIKKDGSSFLAEINITPIIDNGKLLGYLKIIRDLSEREAVENEKKAREDFVITLIHDLRTPLTSAILNAEIIQKSSTGFIKIISSLDRINKMINDLLDANRIQSGNTLPLHVEYCDLHQLMMKVIDDLTLVHGKRFVLNASDSIMGYWSSDGLRRVIENLLINAVKYGLAQSPINIMIKKTETSASFQVHNLGNELSPVEQINIFESHQRLSKDRPYNIRGWGIGLTLVKGILKAHGGTIAVKSESGKGTTFTITIPLDSRPFQVSEHQLKS